MNVFIEKCEGDSLWLIIEREEEEGMAHPILDDEVEAIRDACEVWMEHKSQELMKESQEYNDNKKIRQNNR